VVQVLAENKRVLANYHLLERYEAGLALTGEEVRAVRQKKVNLKSGFAKILGRELWLINAHISTEEPNRSRKLLLRKQEINRLAGRLQEKGITLLPLRLYIKNNVIKVELGLCRGLKIYDKRELVKKRETEKKIQRAKMGLY